jgi:hypothetical protein
MPSSALRISVTVVALISGAASLAHAQDSAPTAAASSDPSSIVPPKPVSTAVEYPGGGTGDATVVIELTVGTGGEIVEVGDAVGPEPFAMATRHAAKSWRFEPATRDGRPVKARIRFEAKFLGAHVIAPPPEPQPEIVAPVASVKTNAPVAVTVNGTRAAPGGASITTVEARMLPGAFGDPFRAVASLPGVTPIVSTVPFFFMRGAPPGNTGYFIDGIRVPQLFHVLLGPAVIPPSLIKGLDVYEGGYPASYGRFAGGIIAAETQSPSDTLHGQASVRLTDAGAMVSTPFDGDRGHVTASGRYSYSGLILSALTDVKLDYWDYQLLANYELTRKDTIGIFAFGAYDYLSGAGFDAFGGSSQVEQGATAVPSVFATQFHRVDVRLDHDYGNRTTQRFAVTVGYDQSATNSGNTVIEPGAGIVSAETTVSSVVDRSIAARTALEHHFGEKELFRVGADVALDDYALNLRDPTLNARNPLALFPSRTELVAGAYTDLELHPLRWVTFRPGLRADIFNSEHMTAVGVDPRVAVEFQVSRPVKLIDAFGIAHQSPNFFPDLPGAQVGGLQGGLQKAVQYSSGVQVLLPEDLTANLTLYEESFFDLSDPLGFSGTISANADTAEVRAIGYGYGAEFSLKRALTRRLGGIFSYTLSRSVRSHNNLSTISAYDRTHVATLALSYDLGNRYRVGLRGAFASGVPTRTLTQTGPIYGGDRAAPLVRLDVNAEKRWRLGKHGYWAVTLEVLNATAGTEVVSRSCNTTRCTTKSVGPLVLPNIGVEAGF